MFRFPKTSTSCLLAGCLLTASVIPHAQPIGRPVRFDTDVALKQVTKRVEPVLPPDLVTANPGAVLAADVVVRANGTVESVTIVTAPPGLDTPLTAALQQWTFQPFLVNGRPVRAVVMIDVALADPRAEAERRSSDRKSVV